jgi:hypothetical protein
MNMQNVRIAPRVLVAEMRTERESMRALTAQEIARIVEALDASGVLVAVDRLTAHIERNVLDRVMARI